MPKSVECPFYISDGNLKLKCEGGILKFNTSKSRREFMDDYCSNIKCWKKCSIAQCLDKYYTDEEKR